VNGERNGVEGSARHDDRPVDEHERARTTMKKASQKAKKGACPRASPPCKLGLSEISSQTIIGELTAAGPAHATILSLSLSSSASRSSAYVMRQMHLRRYGGAKVTRASKRPVKLIRTCFGDSNLHLEIHART